MSDVQFTEEEFATEKFAEKAKKPSGFSIFLIKKGLAKDEAQANKILLGLVLVCLIVILFLM